jgi:hypothetical protein
MRAWERAARWQREHGSIPFEDLLGWHLVRGYVWATPEVFMVAREECYDPGADEFVVGPRNCWFVELAAGTAGLPVREFMRVAPHPLPYVAWCRRNDGRLRKFSWERLAKKVRL